LRKSFRSFRNNWSEEIRKFIIQRIKEEERKKNIQKALEILEGRKGMERGFPAKSVREDRDSN